MPVALTPYEKQREDNIARNHAELARLGLLQAKGGLLPASKKRGKGRASPRGAAAPKKTRVPPAHRDTTPPRRSSRRATAGGRLLVATGTAPTLSSSHIWERPAESHTGEWARRLFSDASSSATKRYHDGSLGRGGWDRRRAHQHLTVSPCGKSVATTGCAGYGACFAVGEKIATGNERTTRRWDVKILRTGTGGFALGVARADFPKPFKSLGNHPYSWVLHSRGRLLHNRQTLVEHVADDQGSSFGEGDILSVVVVLCPAQPHSSSSAVHWLHFLRNGKAFGFGAGEQQEQKGGAIRIELPRGKQLVLAVQPYMGGAAAIC